MSATTKDLAAAREAILRLLAQKKKALTLAGKR